MKMEVLYSPYLLTHVMEWVKDNDLELYENMLEEIDIGYKFSDSQTKSVSQILKRYDKEHIS